MSDHQDPDHPLPVMGCQAHTTCTTWTARMMADDDRSLEELVEVVERVAATLSMRLATETLLEAGHPVHLAHNHLDQDARRIARLALAGCSVRTTAVAAIGHLQRLATTTATEEAL